MYEAIISAKNNRLSWLNEIESELKDNLKGGAVTALITYSSTSFLSVGGEKTLGKRIGKQIRKAIVNLILGSIKREYVYKKIERLKLPETSLKLLSHALTNFDRYTEEQIILAEVPKGRRIDMDGFCNFRMNELYDRWLDVCGLAIRHSPFLYNEDTMDELLHFLVEAGRAPHRSAEIFKLGDKYRIVEYHLGVDVGERVYDEFDEMLCRLIDFSPCETVVCGFNNDKYFKRLNSIFDAKKLDVR
ncbi:MAG: hypothetical protein IJX05_03650 [Clostridia bacterium]|nr:hypothetical protein [Clostridia bacterium]